MRRIWILALSKADLHPELNAKAFQDLIVEKAAGDVSALHDTLKTFVQVPEALSLGEDLGADCVLDETFGRGVWVGRATRNL